MTRRRWIADEVVGDRAALTGAHATHLSRVLRVQVGQEFDVACGDAVRRATVTSASEERVEFALGEEVAAPLAVPITLLLAMFKFDRMEWAIEKCSELNVTSIVPVVARRTEKHLALAAEKRVERWRRIAREAAQQSRRVSVPEIGEPVKLADALGVAADLRIVLAETEREAQLVDVLRERAGAASVALAVGPEGGWAAEELQLFEKASWMSASLGATILRAETAAIAALAIARAEIS
ncbi:MAG TPA: RsmE family RNA methyltransferase [Candidatus Angelobacter sp.]|nr:RsmE family RNA methyltransferase [Candidatus Angelobacter sp.]